MLNELKNNINGIGFVLFILSLIFLFMFINVPAESQVVPSEQFVTAVNWADHCVDKLSTMGQLETMNIKISFGMVVNYECHGYAADTCSAPIASIAQASYIPPTVPNPRPKECCED